MNGQPRTDSAGGTNEPGRLLGAVLIGILVVLLGAAWLAGMSTERPAPSGMGPVFMGLFLIALGSMFFASYFQSSKSFFLRWLLRLSMGFLFFPDRRMAMLLCMLCVVTGGLAIADGLGMRFL